MDSCGWTRAGESQKPPRLPEATRTRAQAHPGVTFHPPWRWDPFSNLGSCVGDSSTSKHPKQVGKHNINCNMGLWRCLWQPPSTSNQLENTILVATWDCCATRTRAWAHPGSLFIHLGARIHLGALAPGSLGANYITQMLPQGMETTT